MTALIIVCHNPDCRDSKENNPLNPRPMVCTGETASAWTFKCQTCGAQRAVTKDVAGGMFGAGRRDDGTGPSTGKGPLRYRPGWRA
jgi:hypothetical protein